MRRVVAWSVFGAVLLAGSIASSGVSGAAVAPKVTGCTAVTPAELQTIFGVPFAAGVSAGPAYLPGDCRFNNAPGQPPATGLSGSVTVSVTPGKKPGAKAYASALAARKALTKTQVLNVGTAAVDTVNSGGKEGCPESGGHTIIAKSAKGFAYVSAHLEGVVVPPSQCGRNGETTALMGQVASLALSKL